jgi:hypothetical protein
MDKKLTRKEFCRLAERQEEIKRKRGALQEWQQKQDIHAVEVGRTRRVRKRMNVI